MVRMIDGRRIITGGTEAAKRLWRSIWLFPVGLTFLLLILTGLKISGSSIGIYDGILGFPKNEQEIIANNPQPIRSDEWLVITQLSVAQAQNNFKSINPDFGNGQDMAIISSLPVKDWSAIFRPDNWAYFVLPFTYAFAFKWWLMAYLLLLSCYFLVVTILPQRRLLAALLAISILFSPFVQWWYQYATLAPIYYTFFIATAFIHLMRKQTRLKRSALIALIAYLLTSFILILYPPFQIVCAFGVGAFAVGHALNMRQKINLRIVLKRLASVVLAITIAGAITGIFLITHKNAVHAITHTAYPGVRIEHGGNYEPAKIFSGYLQGALTDINWAKQFGLNQSENANFILLLPFLFIPSAYLLIRQHYSKDKRIDWALLLVNVAALLLVIRLLTPLLDPLFKLFLFDKIPSGRLIIGLGILSILQLVLVIRRLGQKPWQLVNRQSYLYACICFLACLALSLYIHTHYPGFISLRRAVLLSFPLPFVVLLILRGKSTWGVVLLTVLSIGATYNVNPLYRVSDIRAVTPLSEQIRALAGTTNAKWAVEGPYFEHLPQMNGAPSLSGVYYYPQFSIWQDIAKGKDENIFNRYAHVTFSFDRNASKAVKTHLERVQTDRFVVITDPCSNFLAEKHVGFLIAEAPIPDKCAHLVQKNAFPNLTLYIYEINERGQG